MRLDPDDRSFVREAAALATANPFGAAREEADRALAEAPDELPWDEVVDRVVARMEARLAALFEPTPDVRAFPPDVREELQLVVLFCLFHRLAPDLDAHIEASLQGEAGPAPQSLAQSLAQSLGDLEARGFTAEEADRYVAIVWQARRAYFFIQRMLVGGGPSMRRLRESLWNAVFTHDLLRYARGLHRKMEDFSTFIVGETGAGKTAAAAAIGRSGFIPFDRERGDFVVPFTDCFLPINLSAYPSTLIESELFGHEKGAFTGAVERHLGLFSRCSAHGSVFLDEIGEVSTQVQIKLLHVVQDRRFSPVGSHAAERFEGRVIGATNRSLEAMAAAGDFRPDLFYRLSSDVIEVPPLRQRFAESPDELPQMVAALLERLVGDAEPALVDQVMATVARDVPAGYGWPGNVRELEQTLRRVLLRGDATPTPWPAPAAAPPPLDEPPPEAADDRLLRHLTRGGHLPVDDLLARYCAFVYAETGSYEEAGRRLGLDWRTVKRHAARADARL